MLERWRDEPLAALATRPESVALVYLASLILVLRRPNEGKVTRLKNDANEGGVPHRIPGVLANALCGLGMERCMVVSRRLVGDRARGGPPGHVGHGP